MILYLDTSALVKLYVQEAGRDSVRHAVAAATVVATSRVAYPEARSAMARRVREGSLNPRAHAKVRKAFDDDFARFLVVELTPSLAHRAGELTQLYPLRGFDAIHLASATELWNEAGESPLFLAFDARLTQSAVEAGFRVHLG